MTCREAGVALACRCLLALANPAHAADLIVSANDGKFVRVDGGPAGFPVFQQRGRRGQRDLDRRVPAAVPGGAVPDRARDPGGRRHLAGRQWIALQAMDGSALTPDNPGRHKLGRVLLFRNENGRVTPAGDLPGGEAAQGIVFGRDNKTILVQFDVEKAIAVYEVRGGKLADTGQRITLAAGPVSIRSAPR
jgi:hypothetical protein